MEKYTKLKVLGKGSFGSATLIKRKSDGHMLVVKEVNMSRMSTKEKEEARHEVRVLQQLQHPNITQFVERLEKKGILYIIMEYADGGDLHQKVEAAKRTRGKMKEEMVLHYFAQLCLALEYLHSRHILHRDIKSMNVFLTSSGVVKLGDFGISTVLRNTLGMANTVCGTPYYFSPELCRNEPYNNKSDVWAMGIILYELVTLRHAFDGNSMQQLLQRIVKGSYTPLPSSVNPAIKEMVTMCLQKDPSKRPTMKQLLGLDIMRQALSKLQGDLDTAAVACKPLREVIAPVADPKVEDEAEKVLKAKLAGAKAAAAVAQQKKEQQQQPAAYAPNRVPAAPVVAQPQRYQVYDRARQEYLHNRGQAAGPQMLNHKEQMGNLDEFLKDLGRPIDVAAQAALRREQEQKKRDQMKKAQEEEKERYKKEWEDRQKREKDRQAAAAVKARQHQEELDRVMNAHKERLRQNQERERERRLELKKAMERKEQKEKERKAGKKQPTRVPRSPAVKPTNAFPRPVPQPMQAQQPQHQVDVHRVKNWAERENEKKRQQMDANKRKKVDEEKMAVLEMDAQVYRAQNQQLKHRVLDPELEAWVKRQEEQKEQQQPRKKVDSKEEIRRSVDAIDKVIRSQQGAAPSSQVPPVRRLAANACGSPKVPAGRPRRNLSDPELRPLPGAPRSNPTTAVSLFPAIDPQGMRKAHSASEEEVRPVEGLDVPSPFKPKSKLQHSVGRHQRSFSDVTSEMQLHEHDPHNHDHQRPLVERRTDARGNRMQKLSLQPEELVHPRRDTSAPPVMRTPNKHVDASTPVIELEGESKMEDVPTPVRQWIEPEPAINVQPPSHHGTLDESPPDRKSTLTQHSDDDGDGDDYEVEDDAEVLDDSEAESETPSETESMDVEPEDEVDEDINRSMRAAALGSPSAVKERTIQYNLMRSHIAEILQTPTVPSTPSKEGGPAVLSEPSTAREDSETQIVQDVSQDRSSYESPEPIEEESFGDAEPITPGHLHRVAGASKIRDYDDENGEELEALSSHESPPMASASIADLTETALHRVAAICGEKFSGTQPCHIDGKPLFESSLANQVSLAELLREYLETVLGIGTLTAAYNAISELLQAPSVPSPPAQPKPNNSNGRSSSVQSGASASGGSAGSSDIVQPNVNSQQHVVMRQVTELVLDHIGEDAATDAMIDETVSLVAQLVYFDAEAFSAG